MKANSVLPNLVLAFGAVFALAGAYYYTHTPAIPAIHTVSDGSRHDATLNAYGQLPLSFEINLGQIDEPVKFVSHGGNYSLFLTPNEAVWSLLKHAESDGQSSMGFMPLGIETAQLFESAALRMRLIAAEPDPQFVGLDELPGKVNYFIGNNPANWRTNVPAFAKVMLQDVYPGVDLIYYGNQRQLEYDFVISPGADPNVIVLGFEGADRIEVDAAGDLVLHTVGQQVRMHKPIIYQEINGLRREIPGGYVLNRDNSISFHIGTYDVRNPLIIDPVMSYSTYMGGSGEDVSYDVAVDPDGSVYIAGYTQSIDFPITAGAFDTVDGNQWDAFVAKLAPDGSTLVYSTYLGGSGAEAAYGIAVDNTGAVYVTGEVLNSSFDFPTTSDAFDTTFSGGADAFVTKLDPSGSTLLYSTFLGGSGDPDPQLSSQGEEQGWDIALDASGAVYVTGTTDSIDFPTTPGAFDTSWNGHFDVFVTKLDPSGSTLLYSTFFGGSDADSGLDIARDASGATYVVCFTNSTDLPTTFGAFDTSSNGGSDICVFKLDPTGAALDYSTYLGGADHDCIDDCALAVDSSGAAYIAGDTRSSDFPTTLDAYDASFNGGLDPTDAFVTKLDPSGSILLYSTFIGGSGGVNGEDHARGIAVDVAGAAYITGNTRSNDYPTTLGAFDTTHNGDSDAFVTKLDASGSILLYSTFLGGSIDADWGRTIALGIDGAIYVSGSTRSADFPTTPGAFIASCGNCSPSYADIFVARLHIDINTLAGENVIVQPLDATTGTTPATLTFSQVIAEGNTSLATSRSGPIPPSGYRIGDPPTYYDLSTTATYTGALTVCISYNPAQYGDPSSLRLLHYENGAWTDVTTTNDAAGGVICGQVSSLSPFVIAELLNVPPAVQAITAPVDPVRVNTAINAKAGFTDANASDTHTATWNWGDGTTSEGDVVEGSVSGSHTYTAAGVYTVTLRVTDNSGGAGEAKFQYVVVYDPRAGFVTGGGWIDSPAGAYAPDQSLTGKANFGFVSKYAKGATTPTGQTQFKFHVANLIFRSQSYQWLVVAGAKAQYKGSGTVNGSGDYGFMLTTIDGQINGGGGADKFRIKIWDKGTGQVIYDNQTGAGDTDAPTMVIAGGSIVIHN